MSSVHAHCRIAGCLQPNPFRQGCMVSFTSVLRHYSHSEKTSCTACSRHLSRRRTAIAIQVSIAWCTGHPVWFATDIHGESSGLRKSARTWGLQSRVRVAAASQLYWRRARTENAIANSITLALQRNQTTHKLADLPSLRIDTLTPSAQLTMASCISARSLSQATANSDGAPSMMPGTASTGPYAESVSGCWRISPMGASTTPVAASFSPPPSQQRTITSPKKDPERGLPQCSPTNHRWATSSARLFSAKFMSSPSSRLLQLRPPLLTSDSSQGEPQ